MWKTINFSTLKTTELQNCECKLHISVFAVPVSLVSQRKCLGNDVYAFYMHVHSQYLIHQNSCSVIIRQIYITCNQRKRLGEVLCAGGEKVLQCFSSKNVFEFDINKIMGYFKVRLPLNKYQEPFFLLRK